MTDLNEQLREMRGEYDSTPLRKSDLKECPLEQFSLWLQEASDAGIPDPNACSLATLDEESKRLAAFQAREGAFAWDRLTMGTRPASTVQQAAYYQWKNKAV